MVIKLALNQPYSFTISASARREKFANLNIAASVCL